jgi:flagellar protein FliO/FliZ
VNQGRNPSASPARLLAALLATAPACAPAHAAEAGELASGVGQMIFGLAVVIALLFASLWVLKRVSGARGGSAGLKVLGAAAVGARERVVLVEVADKVLVLGVAPGRVNTLHTLSTADLPTLQASPSDPNNPGSADFASRLRRMLEQRK